MPGCCILRVLRTIGLMAIVIAWLALVATGFAMWERFDFTPGRSGSMAVSPVKAGNADWRLVIFLHPHCPCSSASLHELAELGDQAGPSLAIRVVFVRPPEAPEGWERSSLWNQARAIPGVEVIGDPGGSEASRAGAWSSGHVVLYGPEGTVAFQGGLTAGRGRLGESPAREAILALLAGREAALHSAPVFGCELLNAEGSPEEKAGASCTR